MRTLRIYSLNSCHILHPALFTIFIMLCITALVLIYLITGSLYLLTTFIQFPLPPPPASGNHKPDLFFYEFVCFWSIIDLQHHVSSCYTTWWFDISTHFEMITVISLVTVCHHTRSIFFSNTDTLLVKGPVASLTANRVWGVLRGEFYVVSLLFSSKEIFSVATLGNEAQQNFASLDPL